MIFSKINLIRTNCSPFQLRSRGSMHLSSPPASSSAGHVTRDQPVMTCVTLTWRGFSRLNVTNYEYIQGTINLVNSSGKVIQSSATKNTTDMRWPVTGGVMCPVTGAGERRGGVIMIDISAGDTSAIWHVRWQGITRKIRQGREGQQIRKNIQLVSKKTFSKYLISDWAGDQVVCILGRQWTVLGCHECSESQDRVVFGAPLLCPGWSIGDWPVVTARTQCRGWVNHTDKSSRFFM